MGQVLRRYGDTPVTWRRRRLAAIWTEAALSAFWAHLLVTFTALWLLLLVLEGEPRSTQIP